MNIPLMPQGVKQQLTKLTSALTLLLLLVSSLAYSQTSFPSLTLQNSASSGNGATLTVTGLSVVSLKVLGSSGADRVVTFQASQDGSNFDSIICSNIKTLANSTSVTVSSTTLYQFRCSVSGLRLFRTPVSGGTTGTVSVTALALANVSASGPAGVGSIASVGVSGTLQTADGAGGLLAYSGSSTCSAGQFVTTLSALGAITCGAPTGSGLGDVSSNTSTSVVDEIALFADTTGKLIKRSTGSGLAKLTSGVLSIAASGTDYAATGVDINTSNQVTATHLAAALPIAQGGTSFTDTTFSGNTHKLATTSGTLTANNQATFDASGNLIASAIATGNILVTGTPSANQVATWVDATHIQAVTTSGVGNGLLQTSPTIITPTIAKIANLTTNGFVKTSGGDGTLGTDTATYITGNQTITLSGDATGSGTTAITVANTKLNGVAYSASPATDTLPVITAADTATYKALADCTDTGGNHLNYTASTHSFSCGSSSSGGTPGNAAADGVTKGIAAFIAADFNDNGSGIISLDYTNGQAASAGAKGYLIAADWTTFNNKVATTLTVSTTSPLGGGGDLSANRTLTCTTCTTNASALTANLPVIGAGGQATAVGTRSGNTTQFASVSGALTTSRQLAWDASGNVIASSVAIGDLSDGFATPAKASNNLKRKTCSIIIGYDNNPSVLVNLDLGPQRHICLVPALAVVEEITVYADAGTPNVIVHRRTGTTDTALLSSALTTAASGALACSRTSAVVGYGGATCSASLQNTTLGAGDTIGLTSGTAGGVARRMSIFVSYIPS